MWVCDGVGGGRDRVPCTPNARNLKVVFGNASLAWYLVFVRQRLTHPARGYLEVTGSLEAL